MSSPPPEPRDRAGEVLGSRYVLLRLIARGGMGAVYAASQRPFDREVAIKILTHASHDEDYRRRFFREGSVLANMSHPHVVTVFDYGETAQGELFFAMELLRGETLGKLLHREKRLSSARAMTIAVQLARALRSAHRHGVVHRDLKPANVMMLSEGEGEQAEFAKVLDFGLAKPFVEVGGSSDELTHSGMWLGSPRYMSPEQIRCEPVGPATDIYALGAIMFHMVAGRAPYTGSTSAELFGQHLYHPVPNLAELAPDMPVQLTRLIESCLAKQAEDRPSSMDVVIAQIRTHGPGAAVVQVTSEIPVATFREPAAQLLAERASDGPTPTPSGLLPSRPFGEPAARVGPAPALMSRRALAAAVLVVFGAGLAFGFWLLTLETPPGTPASADRPRAASSPPASPSLAPVFPAPDAGAATDAVPANEVVATPPASPVATLPPVPPASRAREAPTVAPASRAPASPPAPRVTAPPTVPEPTPSIRTQAPPPEVPAPAPPLARPDAGRPALDLDTVPLLD